MKKQIARHLHFKADEFRAVKPKLVDLWIGTTLKEELMLKIAEETWNPMFNALFMEMQGNNETD